MRRALDLEVRVSGVLVGRLDREREGAVRFVPDAGWIAGGMRPRLGLGFLIDASVRRAGSGLPAWFENLLPERRSALRGRVCRDLGLREGQSAALLRSLGRVLPGAVEVIGEADDLEDHGALEPPPGALKVSLAGMQTKLSMVMSGDRFAMPARSDRGDWIVKLPGTSLPELPEVEAATLGWARKVGHDVPDVMTPPLASLVGLPADLADGPATVFAIRRFDRTEDGTRVHQEDFAQVLEIEPEHKYGNTGPVRTSYDRIGRLVLDACGLSEAEEFVRRLAFVVAAGNGDAHLKNWSFQWLPGFDRPRLSPCYDLVADISWPQYGWDSDGGPTLGLALGRCRRLSTLGDEALDTFASRCGIRSAKVVFMDALEAARRAFREIEGEVPLRMRTQLLRHWRAVPLLRRVGPLSA